MGILTGIISFVFGLCINLLDSILQTALGMFSFNFSVLYQAFPFARNSYDIFVAMGLCFLMAGVIWQGLKGFMAPLGTEVENPVTLFFKVAITWFAVVNSLQIVDYVTNFFDIALQGVQDASLDSGDGTVGFIRLLASSILNGVNGIVAIVLLILLIILGWKFLKFWLEIIERYIVYCFICLISPIFIATAAFKSTRNIAETWVRSFFGQSLIIILNAWCCRMFMSFCMEFTRANFTDAAVDWGMGEGVALGHFTLFFLGMAFLNFAMRVDTYLRILGLNTAQTGGSLGRSMGSGAMMAVMTAKRFASSFGGKNSTSATNTTNNNASGSGNGAAGATGAAGGMFSGLFNSATGNNNASSSSNVNSGSGADSVSGMNGSASGSATSAEARYGDLGKSGAFMQPNARILQAESLLEGVAGKQGAANKANGVGGTSKFGNPLDKKDFMVGGMESTRGYQQQFAQRNIGNSNPAGNSLIQDQMTAEAARSVASSAEFTRNADGSINPVVEQGGANAGTLMNGVLAFDNQNLGSLVTSPDGDMVGMQYKDGSTAMFDYVGGGIAEGVYTAPDGTMTSFSMVHDNAVETNNMLAAAGEPGYHPFDASGSVGRVGDGSGTSGYYVIPRGPDETARSGNIPSINPTDPARYTNSTNQAQTADNLQRFINNSNPVKHQSRTLKRSQIEQMRDKARGSTPNPNWWGSNQSNIPKV